jgi:hypothetical protein
MVKDMNKDNPLVDALRALPDPSPPDGLWDDIAERLHRDSTETVAHRVPASPPPWKPEWFLPWFLPGAVAALVVVLALWLAPAQTPERSVGFLDPVIAGLLMESQSLEALVPLRSGSPIATREVLLLRIAEVDAGLNEAWSAESGVHAMEPLLRRRVALLHSLVDLGYRPTTPYTPALRPAVLTGDDR